MTITLRSGIILLILAGTAAPAYSIDRTTDTYRGLYTRIYTALTNLDSGVSTSRYSTSSGYVFKVLDDVLEDHPEIFYFKYSGSSFYSDGWFQLKYRYYKDTIRQMSVLLEAKVDYVLSYVVHSGMTEFQKAKAIHDYLVLHTRYDIDNYYNDTIPPLSGSAYGILVLGTGVCDGYAKAYLLLTRRAGLHTVKVTGNVDRGLHAWNIIRINGSYYQVDVTWDDPVPDSGGLRHKYFLISDSAMGQDHRWDTSQYPACPSTYYPPKKVPSSTYTQSSDSRTSMSTYKSKTGTTRPVTATRKKGTKNKKEQNRPWKGVTLEWSESFCSLNSDVMNELLVSDPGIFLSPYSGLTAYPMIYQSFNRISDIKLILHPVSFFEWGLGYACDIAAAGAPDPHVLLEGGGIQEALILNAGVRLPLFRRLSLYGNADWYIGLSGQSVQMDNIRFNAGVDLKLGWLGFTAYYSWAFSDALSGQALRYEGLGAGIKIWLW